MSYLLKNAFNYGITIACRERRRSRLHLWRAKTPAFP